MKKLLLYILFLILGNEIYSQIDANSLIGLPTATDLTEITGIVGPQIGALVYNLDDDEVYRFTSTGWQISADDQFDDEVPLRTAIDVNGVPTDPSPANETNMQEVIQAIAPITSKAGRVFYPPSIEIDASVISTTDETIDLYQQYVNQYDLTQNSTVINGVTINYQTAKNPSAPDDIPIYAATDLNYYVTFADSSVFNIISLSDAGLLTYRIVGQPSGFNTLINVVFVVK